MGVSIRIADQLYWQAKIHALTEGRTISKQVEFWAMVGKTALDNPDLPVNYVRELLIARSEERALATPFKPRTARKNTSLC